MNANINLSNGSTPNSHVNVAFEGKTYFIAVRNVELAK